ncbi:MAG TPA: tetratricopeptide repeat protein [Parvibaculum sp.]|jgi:hypothetical protein
MFGKIEVGLLIAALACGCALTPALASDNPQADAKAAFENHDYAAAAKILEPVAAQGDAAAQYNLGMLYGSGLGVAKDQAAAASWYEKAARQGKGLAQLAIGVMYRNGQGVEADYPRAYMWLTMSASELTGTDNQQAMRFLKELKAQMTPEQMQSALDMVDNCQQVGVKNCD